MGEPIRSTGQLPKRWKRRQHAERQARLARAQHPNRVTVVAAVDPELLEIPKARPVTVTRGQVATHGAADTETARHHHRWDPIEGKLLSLTATRRCSICSRWVNPPNAMWRNPFAAWWTCTTCRPVTAQP